VKFKNILIYLFVVCQFVCVLGMNQSAIQSQCQREIEQTISYLRGHETTAQFFNNPLCNGLTAKDFILQGTQEDGTQLFVATRIVKENQLYKGVQVTIPLKPLDGVYFFNGNCNLASREDVAPLDETTILTGRDYKLPNLNLHQQSQTSTQTTPSQDRVIVRPIN
jgi:hypothetical protein